VPGSFALRLPYQPSAPAGCDTTVKGIVWSLKSGMRRGRAGRAIGSRVVARDESAQQKKRAGSHTFVREISGQKRELRLLRTSEFLGCKLLKISGGQGRNRSPHGR